MYNNQPAILFPIHAKWCEKIANGEKTVEVRKTRPKLQTPYLSFIYCTKGSKWHGCYDHDNNTFGLIHTKNLVSADKYNLEICDGKVIGEFVCDKIFDLWPGYTGNQGDHCLTYEEELAYLGDNGHGYGIHISELKIYDKPLDLYENFRKPCVCPEMPYCPSCWYGYVHISESEAEAYRAGQGCETEWHCLNHLKAAPQSWCRVERV